MTSCMVQSKLRLAVIIGSTRENRFAETVANWFLGEAEQHPETDIDVIDLADINDTTRHTAKMSPRLSSFVSQIDGADAFVVITPEYNHGYPASLKFAIDSAHSEWQAKPVGFVSYGGISGGLRSVEQLRQVFAELHTVTVRDTVSFHMAGNRFDPDGRPHDREGPSLAAKTMLDQLTWWGRTLREARAERPYGE